MKIGIVTFYRSSNYGAELQAYATQTYLQHIGHKASVVDYWPEYRKDTERILSLKQLLNNSFKRGIRLVIQVPFICCRFYKRWKSTRRFVNKYLRLSEDRNYDVVIYGSDQIWRKMNYPLFMGYDKVYFGDDHIKAKKKVSYAASMGKVIFSDVQEETVFLKLLKNFSAISVREADLQKYIANKLQITVPMVCDPVFLLSKKEWESLVDSSYIPKHPYVLYYNLHKLSITTSFVKYLQREMNLPIIEMRGTIPFFHYGRRYRLTADAIEFLSLLSGASIVVSSSFHGVALSICLEKQFYYACRTEASNRVESLLDSLCIKERKIVRDFEGLVQQPHIDYNAIRDNKEVFINKSKEWLITQLK